MKFPLITTLLLCGLVLLSCKKVNGFRRGSMYIQNNEYHNMLIAISENVKEDERLITRIKEVFTWASQFLFQATRQRAYFKTITILVPQKWDKIDADIAVNETHDQSEVVVDHPQGGQGDTPFTVKCTPCGVPGYYMRLTPDYLKNENVAFPYGPYDKTVVHEFAHLRYGVYDEFPSEHGGDDFYAREDGTYTGTRCSGALPGSFWNPVEDRACETIRGVPEPDCRWVDQEGDITQQYASLMYRQYLDHIVEFCDDEVDAPLLHNKNAPTAQNIQCFRKSVWQVMREHADFKNGNNPPNNEVESTAPVFRIVRQQKKKTVLVLDTSGSMNSEGRIDILAQACSNYISHIIRDGEFLGIVWFSDDAKIEQKVIVIDDNGRKKLLKKVPDRGDGSTAIGRGIQEGLEALSGGSDTRSTDDDEKNDKGGTLIVVSDGEENVEPYVAEVVDQVLEQQVIVHSIAITNAAASSVDQLAQATGGLSFFVCTNPSCSSNAINEAFSTIAELNISPDQQKYTLTSYALTLFPGATKTFSVTVDTTLGNNTEFIFDYQNSNLEFSITAPTGQVFTEQSPEVVTDDVVFTSRLTFMEASGVGMWDYSISNTAGTDQRIAVSVTSMSAQTEAYPIVVQAFWGTRDLDMDDTTTPQIVYAMVVKGYAPVLKAKVVAEIEKPDNTVESIVLLDNGAGADTLLDDGIYSAYYMNFAADGRYGLAVTVSSDDETVVSSQRVVGSSAASRYPDGGVDAPPDEPTGEILRQSAGGSFELVNFVQGQKFYEPGRVTDLTVVDVEHNSNTVHLSWTGVGEQLDTGNVTKYDLRFGLSFDAMADDFDNQEKVTSDMLIEGDLNAPQPPGRRETVTVLVPQGGEVSYVFGVRAWDEDGRNVSGPVSNLAVASLTPYVAESSGSTDVGLIVGLTVGAVVLVAIVVVLAGLLYRNNKMKKVSNKNKEADKASGNVNRAYKV